MVALTPLEHHVLLCLHGTKSLLRAKDIRHEFIATAANHELRRWYHHARKKGALFPHASLATYISTRPPTQMTLSRLEDVAHSKLSADDKIAQASKILSLHAPSVASITRALKNLHQKKIAHEWGEGIYSISRRVHRAIT